MPKRVDCVTGGARHSSVTFVSTLANKLNLGANTNVVRQDLAFLRAGL
jgi:hypothetical protein